MGLFGAQLVFSMIVASFLQKLSEHFSFSRWLMCYDLIRYLHPTDEELREAGGIPPPSLKGRGKKDFKKNADQPKDNTFTIPRNLSIQLSSSKVTAEDVVHLHFFSDYKWLVDFALCAAFVYFITELYYWLTPHHAAGEVNLSVIWGFMVITFIFKVLWSLTAMYFRGEDGGERAMCLTFGFFCLVMAMAVLIVDESILEFGLQEAYQNFTIGATEFLAQQGRPSSVPASQLSIKAILAITSSIIGAFLVFPGLRLAQMYSGSLRYCGDNFVLKLLLHLNFSAPVFVMLMWVKPVGREVFTRVTWGRYGVLMTSESFESFRLWLPVGFAVLRFCLTTLHLQAYLNLAHERVAAMKKEAGRINSLEFQRKIARVFYYLCVVTLHYLIPVILLINVVFLLKTLGGLSWCSTFCDSYDDVIEKRKTSSLNKLPDSISDSLHDASAQLHIALSSLSKVFSPVFFRGILTYCTWWICAVNFASQAFGMMYYSYFTEQ